MLNHSQTMSGPGSTPTAVSGGQANHRLSAEQIEALLWLAGHIEASLAGKVALERTPVVMQMIQDRFQAARQHGKIKLPSHLEQQFLRQLIDEVLGFGPLEPLLGDESVSEVMVNGPHQIYIERKGKIILADVQFKDDDHVIKVINRIVEPLGRRVDANSPLVDARLPDGSRVNAVVPPCAIDGPSITIRKFSKDKLTVKNLLEFNSLTQDMATYLEACVVAKLNIVVSGGTGSGKTTLLNILSSAIPDGDRIVTIEDAAELSLQKPHVVRLETRHANNPQERTVSIRDLVINSLRMRPERIVVGECRGGEALDMLQAMNTGHDGSLTTVHSNSPRDAISRLETLVMMAGMDLPLQVVRKQIASAVNMIVQASRLRDGSRKVIQITEVVGMEGENVVMQDVFKFEDYGEEDGKVMGEFTSTGLRPAYNDRLKMYGFNLPATFFMRSGGRR